MPLLPSPSRPLPDRLRTTLSAPLFARLATPHGVSRYLEHVHPLWTLEGGRAQVTAIVDETPRMRTFELQTDHAWTGHRAGQHVRLGVTVDGAERTRTYTVTASEHRADGRITLTVAREPDGLVSGHLHDRLQVGDIVACSPATGDVVLPDPRPTDLLLLSAGSGITPALATLRTLADEGHTGEVRLLHHAKDLADVPARDELRALAARPGTTIAIALTDDDAADAPAPLATLRGRFEASHLDALDVDVARTTALACGPHGLLETLEAHFAELGAADRLTTERFTPAPLLARGGPAGGTVTYETSDTAVTSDGRSLLEQAEDAGLEPAFGCRMGICHTCTRRVTAGAVTDLRTGRTDDVSDREVDLCVSVPAGDVVVEL